ILLRGGNAVDAAVAAVIANGVVQPFASTIGGGGVAVVYDPPGKLARGFDYRSEAPASAHSGMFTLLSSPQRTLTGWSGVSGEQNRIGHRSIAVPGSIAGLTTMHREMGRLSLSDVIRPALELCEGGFTTDWFASLMQGVHLGELLKYPWTAHHFLRDG